MFRLSVLSSVINKFFVIGLQGLAIPVAYHALGQHQYELYLLLSAALATLAIAQLGAGPGLTQGIAKANAEGKPQEEGALLGAALQIVAGTSVVGGAVLIFIIHTLPIHWIFGASFVHDRGQILSAANVCVLALIAQLVAGVVDSALAGYQEQVLTNLGAAVSNGLSIGLLIAVCHYAPSVSGVILVLYGAPTLSRAANLVYLLKRRPYLLVGLMRPIRSAYSVLLNVGVAFWLMQLASILEQHSGNFILAHDASTHATDVFATVFRGVALATAFMGLLTQPLWPAFTDAITRRETDWIIRSFRKVRLLLMGYSTTLGLVVIFAGSAIFQHFLRIDVRGYGWLFFVVGLYAVANTWTHLFYVTMMGLQGIWKVAAVQLLENLLMILMGVILAPRFGPVGMALAYLLASVLLPVWILPRMMSATLVHFLQEDLSSKPMTVASLPAQ